MLRLPAITRTARNLTLLVAFCLLPQLAMSDIKVAGEERAPGTLASITAEVKRTVASISTARSSKAIVTVGYRSFENALADRSSDLPIIATFISSTAYAELLGKYPHRKLVTAIYSNPDPVAQYFLAKQFYANGTVAVIETDPTKPVIEGLANEPIKIIRQQNNGLKLIRQLEHVDVLIALPDEEAINGDNVHHIIRFLYQQRAALIGYSRKLTDIGSLASIYPARPALLAELKKLINEYEATGFLPAPRFVNDWQISVNRRLARSLNMAVPSNSALLEDIHSEMGATK